MAVRASSLLPPASVLLLSKISVNRLGMEVVHMAVFRRLQLDIDLMQLWNFIVKRNNAAFNHCKLAQSFLALNFPFTVLLNYQKNICFFLPAAAFVLPGPNEVCGWPVNLQWKSITITRILKLIRQIKQRQNGGMWIFGGDTLKLAQKILL